MPSSGRDSDSPRLRTSFSVDASGFPAGVRHVPAALLVLAPAVDQTAAVYSGGVSGGSADCLSRTSGNLGDVPSFLKSPNPAAMEAPFIGAVKNPMRWRISRREPLHHL
ncbi:unnamed protein product [Natator depressus]